MKRIRNLALVAVAALAVMATVGSGIAAASEFKSESAPATIKSASNEANHSLKFHSLVVSCEAPKLEGTLAASSSSSLETSAQDTKCGGFPLAMNGCKFTYRPGRESSPGVFEGTFDIGPAGCGPIQFGGSKYTCTATISSKSGLQAKYENLGSGKERSVKVTAQTSKLKYSQVSGGNCPPGSYEDGEWSGSWTLQGFNSGGGRVGLRVEGFAGELPATGLAIAGSPAKLTAGAYPLAIAGSATASHSMQFAAGKLSCSTANYSSSITAATTEIPVQAEYKSCTFAGLAAAVNMNGCSYAFSVLNLVSPYRGTAGIACPAGKAIEVVAPKVGLPKCIVTIGAQTADPEGVTYTNEASSTVGVGLATTGIDYHQQKGTAEVGNCTTADSTTGTYTGSSTLTGAYQ